MEEEESGRGEGEGEGEREDSDDKKEVEEDMEEDAVFRLFSVYKGCLYNIWLYI